MGIDAALVRRLLSAQFPQWADLPIKPVDHDGHDNRSFRLGGDLSVRIPSAERYAAQVPKEHHWLPRLTPHLPVPIPVPLAMGHPSEDLPWHWSVYRWLEGESALTARIPDRTGFAASLAGFLVALYRIDPAGGPVAGPHNFYRGGPLAVYDTETRLAIEALGGRIERGLADAVWEAALGSAWSGPPVWVHGDFCDSNLLVRDGRLSSVIDFGCSGVGDPACDLTIAWTFLSGEAREAFRSAVGLDRGTWARARGWALWKSLIMMAGHAHAKPWEEQNARHVLDEVMADHRRASGSA